MAWYEVDSLTINVGSIAWGDIARTHSDDGNKLGLNEVAAAPGFDYEFKFESIPALTQFRFVMDGYYEGLPTDTVLAQAWNYTLSTWVSLGMVLDDTSDQTYLFPTIPFSDYVSGGQAKVKFIHANTGIVGHYLRVDQLVIENMGADVTTVAPTTAAPTSVPPTTLVPTTTLTTAVPTSPVPSTTLAPTTLVVTTVVPTTLLSTAAPTTPPPHNADLDVLFNCYGNNYAGVLIIELTIEGHSLSASYGLEDLELSIPITITGEVPSSALYRLIDLELIIETSITGWGVANEERKNWVAWSKIGNVSFELDRVNDAGFRPMSWAGYVYQTLQLGNNVIIYGSGGVTRAFPVSSPAPTFGFKDIST